MNSHKTCRRESAAMCVALLLMLGLYIFVFCAVNFHGFGNFADGDTYSDTLLAKYMWEQKTLFPKNWVFGNQYYVVATPVLSALFYGLTSNLNLSMALATTAETAALLAAVYWLFRSFLGRTESLTALAALVSSVLLIEVCAQPPRAILFVFCSYYSCYLLTAVVVWGDYLQGLFQGKKIRCASFFLGLFLSFATGMQSLRQTCVMAAPLLAFEGLRILSSLCRKRPVDWRPALRAGCLSAANLGGLVLIRLLRVPAVSTYVNTSFANPSEWPARLQNMLRGFLEITGFPAIDKYDTAYIPFLSLFCLICAGIVLAALWRSAARWRAGTAGALDALNALCLLSLLAVAGSTVLLHIPPRSIYFFIWYFWICVSAALLVSELSGVFRPLALALVLMAAVINMGCGQRITKYAFRRELVIPAANFAKIGAYLVEHNYDILYSSVGGASKVCYHTNGNVIASPWIDLFQQCGYLYPQDLIDPEDNQRAAYLIHDSQLEEALAYAAEEGAELTLLQRYEVSTDNFFGLYTSSKQLMRPAATSG